MADTLQDKLNTSDSTIDDTSYDENQPNQAPAAAPAGPPKDKTVAEIIQKHNELLNDPKFQQEAPPETQQAVMDSRQKAYDLYQQRASRAEWAEVAQTIGDAFVRFGAAREGLSSGNRYGSDMSHINTGPGIDYEGRINRYAKDYELQSGMAEKNADAARQSWADREAMRRQSLGEAISPLTEELKPAEQREKEAADYSRSLDRTAADTQAKQQEDRAKQAADLNRTREELASREKIARMTADRAEQGADARDQRSQNREDERANMAETRSLQQALASKQREQRVAAGLFSDITHSGDLGKKSRDKLEATYGKRAGDAGFDMGKLDEIQQSSQKPRSVLGIPLGQTTDEEAVKQKLRDELIDKKAAEVQALRDEIKNHLDKRSYQQSQSQPVGGGNPPSSGGVSSPQAPAPASSGTVRVQYKGKLMDIPAARLQDAVRDGAVQVR